MDGRQATSYHAPLYLAQAKGYFKEEGIKVALLEPNDPSVRYRGHFRMYHAALLIAVDVNETIGIGKVDLGFKAMIHTLVAKARGFPVLSLRPYLMSHSPALSI